MKEIIIEELIKFRDDDMEKYKQEPKITDRKNQLLSDSENDKYNGMFIRNEASKDRDRIKFSRAFRRLEHKAQIYTYKKGDHFRTRLTHSLEVTQIARSLANNLKLNEDLVEAMSLGHDIEHTPFGHQGERTLDKIMSGEDNLSGKIKYKIDYGGFKHNFHSLKILDSSEVKYKEIEGMNLTWQVLEGILKHTRTKRHKNEYGISWDLSRFTDFDKVHKDFSRQKFSVTLEGQIVAIADEIAQRQHDVDDGLRDIELKLKFEDISEDFIREFETVLEENSKEDSIYLDNLRKLVDSIKALKKTEENKKIKNESLYKTNSLVRNIINFFIIDVTIKSLTLLKEFNDRNINENEKIFKEKLIDFSKIGERINDIIETYINMRILNSYNVNRFDGKSIYIIRQLFKAYYTNPRQMPEYILERLSNKINNVSNKFYKIKFNCDNLKKEVSDINFKNSKPDEIEYLLKLLKLEIDLKKLDISSEIRRESEQSEYIITKGNEEYISDKAYADINKIHMNNNSSKKECFIKAMLEMHYEYLSTICDYIAGMTDNYASDEFQNLYLA